MQKAKHGYGTGKLNPNFLFWLFRGVAKMASHATFQYNVLAIDDTRNT